MVSLYTETASFKWPGHKNELCFFRDTLLYMLTDMLMFDHSEQSMNSHRHLFFFLFLFFPFCVFLFYFIFSCLFVGKVSRKKKFLVFWILSKLLFLNAKNVDLGDIQNDTLLKIQTIDQKGGNTPLTDTIC